MFALSLLVMLPLAAEEPPVVGQAIGAAIAPAALPPGALSLYGLIGAPEVIAGYRQGFSAFELEAQGRFNYLEVSAVAEAGLRFTGLKTARLVLAPTVALGVKLNSGVRAFDVSNFGFLAVRPRVGVAASWLLSDRVQLVGVAEVPWAIAVTVTGFQVTPTAGAGLEVGLSQALSLAALGQLGVDVIKEPLGVPQVRLAWAFRIGVGYRLF